jgi:hypothetical protein
VDAERLRLGAICKDMPKLGQFGVAALFHEAGDVVATTPATGLALDREGRDAKVREGVGVVSQGAT